MKKFAAGIGALCIGAAALCANVDAGVTLGWQPLFPPEGVTSAFGLDSSLFIGVSADTSVIPLGIEADIGLFGMNAKEKLGGITVKEDLNYVELGLSLKCPMQASPSLTVSPSVGVSRQLMTKNKTTEEVKGITSSTTVKRSELDDSAEFDFTAIKFGVSSDYLFSANLFIRGSILYGIILNLKGLSTDGPIFSIGAGYRFI